MSASVLGIAFWDFGEAIKANAMLRKLVENSFDGQELFTAAKPLNYKIEPWRSARGEIGVCITYSRVAASVSEYCTSHDETRWLPLLVATTEQEDAPEQYGMADELRCSVGFTPEERRSVAEAMAAAWKSFLEQVSQIPGVRLNATTGLWECDVTLAP